MLGSTLLPTAVHFLVALFALALLFPSAKAHWAADKIALARKEHLRRVKEDTEQSANEVQVHEDARRYAFFHLILGQTLVIGFWLLSVSGSGYLLFTHLPGWTERFLTWLGI